MTVTVKVVEIDKNKKTVTVEAYDDKNGNRVLRSPFSYKQQSKKSIESMLRKELKAFCNLYGVGFVFNFIAV